MNKQPSIGKTPSQMKGNRWHERKGNIMTIEKILALPPAKTVSYFKTVRNFRGGQAQETRFCRTLSDGYMIFVDTCNMRIGIMQGLPQMSTINPCSKKKYDNAYKSLLKILGR